MELLSGHIQMMKAAHGFFLVFVFAVGGFLAIWRGTRFKGAALLGGGLLCLSLAWIFEALTYVLPPSDTFEGSMVHIGGFMGLAAIGGPLVLLGLLLLKAKKSSSKKR